jgi:hypothetical protein
VTPDAQILLFESRAAKAGRPPVKSGRFAPERSLDELASSFFFDDADRRLIARRRSDATCLGFAVQLGTVGHLGRFLEDPAAVPAAGGGVDGGQIRVPAGIDLAASRARSGGGRIRRRSAASTASRRRRARRGGRAR